MKEYLNMNNEQKPNSPKPETKPSENKPNPLTTVNISKPTPRVETASKHDDKKETRNGQ